MPTGTGLDAQLGAKLESVVGTAVVVDKFFELNDEGFEFDPSWVEPSGLRVGIKHKRASRLVQSRKGVSGTVEMDHATRLMGMWWRLCLGSTVTTPTLISGSAYKQIHTPGDFIGKSATIQVGRPEPSGTVRAHTFNGCKVTGWEFTVGDNEIATLSIDFDGWDEATATALATASYTASSKVFGFQQASFFKLGGTPTTAAGETTIATGTTVSTVVKKITIKGTTPLATERYGVGNAGTKREQLENDVPTIEVELDAEWNRTEFYDPFKANTTTALELRLVGDIISGAETDLLSFVIPAMKIKSASPSVSGPDIVSASVSAEAYSNEIDPVAQVKLVSADSAAL